jgi:hypothetical protein
MVQWMGLAIDASSEPPQEFRVLRTHGERLVGLLGTRPDASQVALLRCGSIHTFGMTYPIDVAVVSGDGLVLSARRSLPAGRFHSSKGGFLTLERPTSKQPWYERGQRLRVVSLCAYDEHAL